jgi:hypothetical protein
MNRMLTGFCAVALGLGLLTACSESRTDRVGERPGERSPSASPPTAPAPSTPSTTPPSTTPPGSTTTTPSSPSGTGTR